MICLVYFSPYFPSPSTYKKENLTPQAFVLLLLQPILGDPGGVSRAGLKGATKVFNLCLKTFVAPFLPARLTAPGPPRMLLQLSALSEKCKIMSLSCAPHLHAMTQIETRDCSQFMKMKNPSLSISL